MQANQTVASDDVGSLGEAGQLAIWRSPQAPGCVSGVLDPAFGGHHEVQQSRQIGTHSVINLFHAYKLATLCQALCWAQGTKMDRQEQRIWHQGGQVYSKYLGAGPEDINQDWLRNGKSR